MTDSMVITFSLIMLGQILLSVPLLASKARKSAVCLPLLLFLLATGALSMLPFVKTQLPDYYQLYSAVVFPCFFVLCPSLWFYVEGITAEKIWTLNKKQIRHFSLLWPSLIIGIMIMFLSKEMFTNLFIDDVEVIAPMAIVTATSILVMMLLWLGQCIYTGYLIIHRLTVYRKQLKDVFSNHDDKELNWINWLVFIAIVSWLFSFAALFLSNLFDDYLFNTRTEGLLSLLLVWMLIHFGLQQKPGFVEHNDSLNIDLMFKGEDKKSNGTQQVKYQRSALDKEQSSRIAEKINNIMKQDKLYLKSDLSLQNLANHAAISPNYISQTLNETLSTNFFDFINHWRIEAAKPKIIANQDTVLNIALDVGFNARSSFYKAFKRETGKTPSEFRKSMG